MSTGGSASVFTSFSDHEPRRRRRPDYGWWNPAQSYWASRSTPAPPAEAWSSRALGRSPMETIVRQGAPQAEPSTADELAKLPIKPADPTAADRCVGRGAGHPDKTDGKGALRPSMRGFPGMIHARPKIPPTRYDSVVESVDDSAAKAVPGLPEVA